MKIYFAKTKLDAIVPSKRKEDAGYDFYACFEDDYIKLEPFEVKLVPTGIACAFKKGYYLQIESRSSTVKINLKKNAGIIDSGYRGEIMIEIFNANPIPMFISKLEKDKINCKDKFIFHQYGKAIDQGIIHKIPRTRTKEISYEKLKEISSFRGINGFGSTNKK